MLRRICASALAFALGWFSSPQTVSASSAPAALLAAGGDRVTPEVAGAKRADAQVKGAALIDSGESIAAGIAFDNAASEYGDPVLYLDAGEAYLVGAEKSANRELAWAALERGNIAADILYFHLDSSADPHFRLVETKEIPQLILRAQSLVEDATELARKIDEGVVTTGGKRKRDKAREPKRKPKKTDKKRTRGDGKAANITGAVFVGSGAAMLGIGIAGLEVGRRQQEVAVQPTIYGSKYDEVAKRGKRANMMAAVGLPASALLVGTGVAILVVNYKFQKLKGNTRKQRKRGGKYSVAPGLSPVGASVAVSGRF